MNNRAALFLLAKHYRDPLSLKDRLGVKSAIASCKINNTITAAHKYSLIINRFVDDEPHPTY